MPYLEREDNPWEEVLWLNPSRKKRGGRKVAKKRSKKRGRGRKHRKSGRTFRVPVTVQGGGLLAVGRKRRIRGVKMVKESAFGGKRKRSRKRHRARKRSRKHVSRKYRISKKSLSRMHRTGKYRGKAIREVAGIKKGFEYLEDNPHRGGRRMARRRRSRRSHRSDNPKRKHRRSRKHYVKRHRKSQRRHRSRRRARRRYRRYDNPKKAKRHKKRSKKRKHRKARSFFLLGRRDNPGLARLKDFPFKTALVNGALAGAGLLGSNWLFNKLVPDSFKGTPGSVQNILVKNAVPFGVGLLTYAFAPARFKSAGLALSTVAVALAVKDAGITFLPATVAGAGFGDLGLTYQTFEEVPSAAGAVGTSGELFHGLGSDIVYGTAMPYGSGAEGQLGGLGDSNFVIESARPYGSGVEGFAEEELIAEA